MIAGTPAITVTFENAQRTRADLERLERETERRLADVRASLGVIRTMEARAASQPYVPAVGHYFRWGFKSRGSWEGGVVLRISRLSNDSKTHPIYMVNAEGETQYFSQLHRLVFTRVTSFTDLTEIK